ncbi:hypothetical protein [Sulfurimonas sp.]|uniref:hypothetical protein n=1 Tax=Sulfurimonas sp. TaxID=2022749 RepID=UPI003D0D9ABD
MKKYILFLIFSCFLYAEQGSFSFALSNMMMDYREYDDSGTLLDREKTNMLLGIDLSYKSIVECDNEMCSDVTFFLSAYSGDSDYTGSLISSSLGYGSYTSTTFNALYDVGVEYKNKHNLRYFNFIYGIGIGFHSWYRELSDSQNELYSWFYLMPEIGVSKDIFSDMNLGINMKYKYGLSPTMKLNLISQEFKLGGAEVVDIEIPLIYRLNNQVDIYTSYTYSHQSIDKSDEIIIDAYKYWEPRSSTNDHYLKLGVTIKY